VLAERLDLVARLDPPLFNDSKIEAGTLTPQKPLHHVAMEVQEKAPVLQVLPSVCAYLSGEA
jgi:hypothetical protein